MALEKLRVVHTGRYEDRGYSNESSMANLMIARPEEINNVMTYTYGYDNEDFPLTFLTEGQGKAGVVDIASAQWTWGVMGRLKFNDYVLWFNEANTTPGKGGSEFEVEFATHWLIEQYGLIAPDGQTQVRIMKDLGKGTHGGYRYLLKLTGADPNYYCDLENLAVGKYWSMTAPTISESYSKGNRSNSMGPGKMKSQLEYHRFSKEIGGQAITNQITTYRFKTEGGGTTDLWINEEMRQFHVNMRTMDEERLWYAEYNRNEHDVCTLIDPDNGEEIPHTAGMMQICRESNYDTYGDVLPLAKLNRLISDILSNDSDSGICEMTLMCGAGFVSDFDEAIKTEVKAEGFLTPLGDKMIDEYNGALSYGNYFRRYKTPEGHIITLKTLPFLDKGTMARNARDNGMIHPRTGKPITSHQAFLIDFSTYEGVQNVRKVRRKGNIYKTGILKGISGIPASWGSVSEPSIATEIDMSRYEIKNSYGLQVNNTSKMFQLKCVL